MGALFEVDAMMVPHGLSLEQCDDMCSKALHGDRSVARLDLQLYIRATRSRGFGPAMSLPPTRTVNECIYQ